MTLPNRCLKCGTVLPPDAPAGICPKCLPQAGMDDFADEVRDEVDSGMHSMPYVLCIPVK